MSTKHYIIRVFSQDGVFHITCCLSRRGMYQTVVAMLPDDEAKIFGLKAVFADASSSTYTETKNGQRFGITFNNYEDYIRNLGYIIQMIST